MQNFGQKAKIYVISGNAIFDIVKAGEAIAKKGLDKCRYAIPHTSNCVLETCSIYAVADFRVISILLFPPPTGEYLHHEDQQQGDGWVGVG